MASTYRFVLLHPLMSASFLNELEASSTLWRTVITACLGIALHVRSFNRVSMNPLPMYTHLLHAQLWCCQSAAEQLRSQIGNTNLHSYAHLYSSAIDHLLCDIRFRAVQHNGGAHNRSYHKARLIHDLPASWGHLQNLSALCPGHNPR